MDKSLLIAACLTLLWLLESRAPIRAHGNHKLTHAGINLGFGLVNGGIGIGLASFVLWQLDSWIQANQIGLLHTLSLPATLECLLALLLFDAWQYTWHRLNHRVPLLWQFHAVHHCDAHMDASTALRFHPGEILLSFTARLMVLPLLGMSLEQLLLYELIALPIIFLHHSNTRLPQALDSLLSPLIVTPSIHWVHHSRDYSDLNSNYASVLSLWDRLFGSATRRSDTAAIALGLDASLTDDSSSLREQWLMPFAAYSSNDPVANDAESKNTEQ